MHGQELREFPHFPFCSFRCKRIDLGRWLGEQYRVAPEPAEEEAPPETSDETP